MTWPRRLGFRLLERTSLVRLPTTTNQNLSAQQRETVMSLGLILIIVLLIFLLGGFSGRFGGPGYGYGHRGNGLIGIILIIVVILLLTNRL